MLQTIGKIFLESLSFILNIIGKFFNIYLPAAVNLIVNNKEILWGIMMILLGSAGFFAYKIIKKKFGRWN